MHELLQSHTKGKGWSKSLVGLIAHTTDTQVHDRIQVCEHKIIFSEH